MKFFKTIILGFICALLCSCSPKNIDATKAKQLLNDIDETTNSETFELPSAYTINSEIEIIQSTSTLYFDVLEQFDYENYYYHQKQILKNNNDDEITNSMWLYVENGKMYCVFDVNQNKFYTVSDAVSEDELKKEFESILTAEDVTNLKETLSSVIDSSRQIIDIQLNFNSHSTSIGDGKIDLSFKSNKDGQLYIDAEINIDDVSTDVEIRFDNYLLTKSYSMLATNEGTIMSDVNISYGSVKQDKPNLNDFVLQN